MPGKVSYPCANWEQSVACGAMHSAICGRPVATLQIVQCSHGEWKDRNEKVILLCGHLLISLPNFYLACTSQILLQAHEKLVDLDHKRIWPSNVRAVTYQEP